MPALRTEITEIITGLGMLGLADLDDALSQAEGTIANVPPEKWAHIRAARQSGEFDAEFATAWANGRQFLEASEGLRGRRPLVIEWKGPQQPAGYDFLPADLRIDHVYLVSCKYLSKILTNSSPTNLFRRCLADRVAGSVSQHWYDEVAPTPLQTFYDKIRNHLDAELQLPTLVADLGPGDIHAIRTHCAGAWPQPLRQPWSEFSFEIATASAEIWNTSLTSPARREEMLWRLLRFGPAPYFMLGSSPTGPLRLRVATPWDWRQHFSLESFTVGPRQAGQPTVSWDAAVRDRDSGGTLPVSGHVEVRWSHGRFSSVEAKVYLDTPHDEVPGYFTIGS